MKEATGEAIIPPIFAEIPVMAAVLDLIKVGKSVGVQVYLLIK